jgi:hypothetical protein
MKMTELKNCIFDGMDFKNPAWRGYVLTGRPLLTPGLAMRHRTKFFRGGTQKWFFPFAVYLDEAMTDKLTCVVHRGMEADLSKGTVTEGGKRKQKFCSQLPARM